MPLRGRGRRIFVFEAHKVSSKTVRTITKRNHVSKRNKIIIITVINKK